MDPQDHQVLRVQVVPEETLERMVGQARMEKMATQDSRYVRRKLCVQRRQTQVHVAQ